MNLSRVLQWRYPEGDPATDWFTQYDAAQEREIITGWNTTLLGAQPTNSEIDAWYLPAARYYKRREMRQEHNLAYRSIPAFNVDGDFMEGERDFALRQEAKGIRAAGDGSATGDALQSMDNLRARLANRIAQVNDQQKSTVAAVESVTW